MSSNNLGGRAGDVDMSPNTSAKRLPNVTKRSLDLKESLAIRHLSMFSLMTAQQLACSSGRTLRTSQKALAGLLEKNLVSVGGLIPEGNVLGRPQKAERVFSLNRDGVNYVEHFGISTTLVNRKPVARDLGGGWIQDEMIRHKLGVVDCMVWLVNSFNGFRTLDLVRMTPDFIKNSDKESVNKDTFGDGNLVPDIVASAFNNKYETSRSYYIEYDRGTEKVWLQNESEEFGYSLHGKFKKYNAYFGKEGRAAGDKDPLLLFVCETEERVEEIRRSKRLEWGKWKNLNTRFHLSCRARVKDGFLTSNWHQPMTDECFSIIEKVPA